MRGPRRLVTSLSLILWWCVTQGPERQKIRLWPPILCRLCLLTRSLHCTLETCAFFSGLDSENTTFVVQWMRLVGLFVLQSWKMLGVYSLGVHVNESDERKRTLVAARVLLFWSSSLMSFSLSWGLWAYCPFLLGARTWLGMVCAVQILYRKSTVDARLLPVLPC